MKNDDENKIKCKCKICEKTFNKGDEGDNEHYCLRCEREYLYENSDFDFDYEIEKI